MRFFNTAGPVQCDRHYCLPPLERFNLDDVLLLIEQRKYFVLHAPRQTGKTSALLALMAHLNRQGKYHCVYINVEVAQYAGDDAAKGINAILNELSGRARDMMGDLTPQKIVGDNLLQKSGEGMALNELLTRWAAESAKPLVLLIDEIDALVGDTLIAVLRQLRAGYDKRPAFFPQSVVLCGVRDVRDYRIHSTYQNAIITGGSAFNIKAESLRLGNFTEEEVSRLYRLHTAETGQAFEPEALELAWRLTRGQPWLVNALAYEVCFKMEAGKDRLVSLTAEMVNQAKDQLILRRETHLDQLADKLKEERVRRVISPMLQGADLGQAVKPDDIDYVIDLGLISRDAMGLQIANPIYREVIPRELSYIAQLNLESTIRPAWYIAADGRLDMDKLLKEFQQFFREHSESWVERFDYKEAGPQLLLQAFLQRIINGGGGRVEREYGLGRLRTDLLVIRPYPGGRQRAVIELKLLRKSLEETIAQGVAQTWEYQDRCGAETGHLVIFDRRAGKSWEEKLFVREEEHRGKRIKVWGM